MAMAYVTSESFDACRSVERTGFGGLQLYVFDMYTMEEE